MDKYLKDSVTRLFPNKNLEVIHVFDVLHNGWEMDNTGLVVEVDGARHVVLFNHGSSYVAKRSEVEGKLQEYRDVVDGTEKALALLEKLV